MKNYNRRKSILEQGGLMIEALAMLGLIAVVTPTMYKKSAERTMEVEDINTATTMRTFMNAAEAYMNANYINIMKDTQAQVQEDGIGIQEIDAADLRPYLPYNYDNSGGLFNYAAPKVRVVRSGDNLTAFALFPAKVGGDDGIGQERTVRIASLIGANGGYVNKADNSGRSARGVGGVWNLDNDHYKTVFGEDDDAKQFSLVTSSSNVVNSSTAAAQADNTKYLQRTKENDHELWRNSMRTDLYMGQPAGDNTDPDHPNDTNKYSIRNIDSLIVGAETEGEQKLREAVKAGENYLDSYKVSDGYGLYIAGSGNNGAGPGNAYIKGTVVAAGNRLWASDQTLKYTGTNLEFDGTNFRIGKNQTEASKDADNYVISGYAEKGNSQLAIMGTVKDNNGNMTGVVDIAEKGDIGHYKPNSEVQKKANVIINTTHSATNSAGTVTPPKYSANDQAPEFGVDVNGNMVVEGVLAAGQLDVNKIRTSSISVGSENINDEYKWMDVDKDGVHVHDPNNNTTAKGTAQVEVKTNLIAMRTGGDKDFKTDNTVSDHTSQIIMSDNGIIERVAAGKNLALATDNIGINIVQGTGANSPRQINIGNVNSKNNPTIDTQKSDDYQVNYEAGSDINVRSGNLKVSKGGKAVFTVRGKNNIVGIEDKITGNNGNTPDYNIAGHGNTVFTDDLDNNGNQNVKYLEMQNALESDKSKHAAVNIIKGNANSSSDTAKGIMYVDMDDGSATGVATVQVRASNANGSSGSPAKTAQNSEILPGSIYIRKGLIDIVPDTSLVGHDEYPHSGFTADNGRGVIRASRLVANNVDFKGNRVVVPDMLKSGIREQYNGEGVVRYDTYMVNPAYTSVMNDIKLVSRGGARLSDILPVFITKGIYTAVNNKPETTYYPKMLEADSDTMYITNDGRLSIDKGNTSYDVREPASPIIGVVPAPQCPPGYARMITVTPASIRMSEAGRFKNPTSSGFNGIKIDVDDFTNPTYGGSWVDANGNSHDIDDLPDGAFTPGNPNYVSPSNINAEGMANQLFNAYRSTLNESTGKTDVRILNPSYQEGVHLVGGNEKWGTDANGYDGKMEMVVSRNPGAGYPNGNSGSWEGGWSGNLYGTDAPDTVTKSAGQLYTVVSKENSRGGTNPSISGVNDIQQTIRFKDTNAVAKVYTNTLASANANEYNKTANVISSPANTLPLTIHYEDPDTNMLVNRDYEINQDLDISGTRILADQVRNVQFESRPDGNGNSKQLYMLTSENVYSFEPITFQKSTWLKSMAIPLSKQGEYSSRSTSYATGWAIVMGFIYPRSAYESVLSTLGVAGSYQKLPTYDTATKRYAGGYDEQTRRQNRNRTRDEYFFWNVFPVEQESLEAFVTTYCYFDQDNKAFEMFKNADHLPGIDYINTFTGGYEPEGDNVNYRKQLNDPAMKYNELW